MNSELITVYVRYFVWENNIWDGKKRDVTEGNQAKTQTRIELQLSCDVKYNVNII